MFNLSRFWVSRAIGPTFATSQRQLRGRAVDFASEYEKCSSEGDLPSPKLVESTDPYEPEKPKCLFCRYKIRPDYRNVRLLSQFVSSFTGRVYEQNVTGLCLHQYKILRSTIITSRKAGFMPVLNKQPRYLKDPKLFDPMRPIRPNPF